MDSTKCLELLQEMGLSHIESVVYSVLAAESPLTGYRIAEISGKSRSNVYQALKTLEQKGYVSLLEGNETLNYVAVPIDILLEQEEIAFMTRKKAIKKAFENSTNNKHDNVIVNLKTIEQLMAKAKSMIMNAENILLLDTVDSLSVKFKDELRNVADKNVVVLLESLGTTGFPGCVVVGGNASATEEQLWPVDWFVLSVDSKEFIVAFLTCKGELINAVWANNIFIANWLASGMGYDFLIHHIMELFEKDTPKEVIKNSIIEFAEKYFFISKGYRELQTVMERFRDK